MPAKTYYFITIKWPHGFCLGKPCPTGIHRGPSSSLREAALVSYGLVGLLCWGRSYGERVVYPHRHVSKVLMMEAPSYPGAPLWGFWSKFQQKFPPEFWLHPISVVICDIKICKLGGSGVPWRGSCRRDDLATQLRRAGPEAFPSRRRQSDMCTSPSGNEVVAKSPGVHIRETTAVSSG